MRTATIQIRTANEAMEAAQAGFLKTWKTGKYGGEHFTFESPAALFRVLTPKRWELIEALQATGPLGVRALARAIHRDVKRVHDDATAMLAVGLIEKTAEGKLTVPFAKIQVDFVIRSRA